MAVIPLRRLNGDVVAHVAVDDADFERLNRWTWRSGTKGYARRSERRNGKVVHILLHRLILGLEPGDPREGDHKDRDRLNCRRSNLRIVNPGQNAQNKSSYSVMNGRPTTSRYRGVCWNKKEQGWQAQCKLNGENNFLGYFTDELEAARVAWDWRQENMTHTNDGPRP